MSFDAYTTAGQGENRFQPLPVLAKRDPVNGVDFNDPGGGPWGIGQRWFNSINKNYWRYQGQGIWVLDSSNPGTILEIAVPLGTSPIEADASGKITFTSNANTVAITGSTAGNPNFINFDITGGSSAIEKINVDASTAPGTNPVVPNAGQITLTGGQVAAGTTTNVIRTDSLAANTYTIQVQRSQSASSSTVGDNGVSHYNSAQFTVDPNAFVSITNFSPFNYVQITHNGTNPSPYTVSATDYYISCDTTSSSAGSITINLPNAPTTYRQFTIKDRTGGASTNNITITTVGGVVTIDGATSYIMAGNFHAVNLLFNGTSYEVY
jgi:hypothetical protein